MTDEKGIPFGVLLTLMLIMAISGGVYFSARRDEQGQSPWYANVGLIMFICSVMLFALATWAYIRQYKINQDVRLMEQWSIAARAIAELTPTTGAIYCAVFLDGATERPALPVGTEQGTLIQGTWVNARFAFRYLAPIRNGREMVIHGREMVIHGRENRRQREAIIAEMVTIGAARPATPGKAAVLTNREQAVLRLREIFQ